MKIAKFFALLCAAATLSFVGCEPVDDNTNGDNNTEQPGGNEGEQPGGNEGEQPGGEATGFELLVNKTAIAVGETVTFTVMDDGVDVTTDATIYDKNMGIIEDATFTAEATGVFRFFANMGAKTSQYVYVTVLASVPTLPEDTDAANTKFNHRILLVDHTGVNCGFCPYMIDNLLALEEDETWGEHFTEVTNHAGTFAAGDPANSPAANIVDQFYGSPGSKPDLRVNFYCGGIDNALTPSIFVADAGIEFEKLVKTNGADAGIAIATSGDSDIIYASVAVKAAVEQEYKITAWLLENNIYSSNQAGASKPEHYKYNHAVRNIAGNYSRTNIQGESFGIIKAGETITTGFELEVTSTGWNADNMEVLVIVSAKDKQGRWEVANSLVCPVNQSVNFEYIK